MAENKKERVKGIGLDKLNKVLAKQVEEHPDWGSYFSVVVHTKTGKRVYNLDYIGPGDFLLERTDKQEAGPPSPMSPRALFENNPWEITSSVSKDIKADLLDRHSWFPFITTTLRKLKSVETPAEIREDLKQEWNLMKDFFTLYEKKINDIKNSVNDWKSGNIKRIEESQEFIKDVYKNINPRLEKKVKELLASIKRIDKKIFVRIKRAYNLKDKNSREQLEELQRNITQYTKQIRNNLYFLKKLYRHQTRYIKDKGAGQIEGDLEKHSFLYRSLTDELRADKKLKRNLIGFLRLVQLTSGIDRRSEKYKEKIPEDQKQKNLEKYVKRVQNYVEGYRIEEILNPSNRELNEFYDLMKEWWGEDELDEMDVYRDALKIRSRRLNHKKWVNHILLLKKDNKIIGGLLMDFVGCGLDKELSIGILWFYLVPKEHEKRGFPILMDFAEKILENDRNILGYKLFGGVFFEMEEKMYNIVFKRKAKFLGKIPAMVDIKYIQPKLTRNTKPLEDYRLFFYPMKKEWEKAIPVLDFAKMFRNFIIAGDFYWIWQGYEPERDPSVLNVLRQLFDKVPNNFHEDPNYLKLKPKKPYIGLIY